MMNGSEITVVYVDIITMKKEKNTQIIDRLLIIIDGEKKCIKEGEGKQEEKGEEGVSKRFRNFLFQYDSWHFLFYRTLAELQ